MATCIPVLSHWYGSIADQRRTRAGSRALEAGAPAGNQGGQTIVRLSSRTRQSTERVFVTRFIDLVTKTKGPETELILKLHINDEWLVSEAFRVFTVWFSFSLCHCIQPMTLGKGRREGKQNRRHQLVEQESELSRTASAQRHAAVTSLLYVIQPRLRRSAGHVLCAYLQHSLIICYRETCVSRRLAERGCKFHNAKPHREAPK